MQIGHYIATYIFKQQAIYNIIKDREDTMVRLAYKQVKSVKSEWLNL